MSLASSMNGYFDRLLARWQEAAHKLPQIPFNEKAHSSIYVGHADDNGLVLWKPQQKTVRSDFTEVESAFGVRFHASVVEYFNTFWFASMGGKFGRYGIQLNPVLPGIEINQFVLRLAGYRTSHENKLDKIPIGVEKNGLLVVVDNSAGRVFLEDCEPGVFEELARSLEELIEGLAP